MTTPLNITKDTATLTDDTYKHPGTSTLIFHFTPNACVATFEKIKKGSLLHTTIDGKDLYVIDNFFSIEEQKELNTFSSSATFSMNSYGSMEAIAQGEKPAFTMNTKERWQLFARPPKAIESLFSFFSLIAHQLNADITTLPWELKDKNGQGSPAVLANKIEKSSALSMDLGIHQDYDPEKKLSFSIPVLHGDKKGMHQSPFINGDTAKPWMLTVMIYDAADNFTSDFGLGTVFYDRQKKEHKRLACHPMRIVLFEGSIYHSIEESKLNDEINTWRISYVFKIIINPRDEHSSVKKSFFDYLDSTFGLHDITEDLCRDL